MMMMNSQRQERDEQYREELRRQRESDQMMNRMMMSMMMRAMGMNMETMSSLPFSTPAVNASDGPGEEEPEKQTTLE